MRILRILVGYLIACFGAALALGVYTYGFSAGSFDAALDKAPDIIESAWNISPPLTGVILVIAAIPALLLIQYAESNKIRSWAFYALVAAAFAVAAYWLAIGTEMGSLASDGNLPATLAFAVSGLVFGTLYWLFSGRHAAMPYITPPSTAMSSASVVDRPEIKGKSDAKPAPRPGNRPEPGKKPAQA
jgi:hypothetical protein